MYSKGTMVQYLENGQWAKARWIGSQGGYAYLHTGSGVITRPVGQVYPYRQSEIKGHPTPQEEYRIKRAEGIRQYEEQRRNTVGLKDLVKSRM